MTFTMRDGSVVADPRLGRLPHFDPASRRYQIRDTLRRVAYPAPRSRTWRLGVTLDQGSEGACAGFASAHRRSATPVPVETGAGEARELYWAAQRLDPWPGGSVPGAAAEAGGERYEGTSVLAAMKAGRHLGWWGGYGWVGAGSGTLERDVVDTLSHVGPIVAGPGPGSMTKESAALGPVGRRRA